MANKLTKNEIKLILGMLDSIKYDKYAELWLYSDRNELENICNKLERTL